MEVEIMWRQKNMLKFIKLIRYSFLQHFTFSIVNLRCLSETTAIHYPYRDCSTKIQHK